MLESEVAFERRALDIFDALLDESPSDLQGWLTSITRGDNRLIATVLELVAADRASSVLPTLPPEPRYGEGAPPPARIANYRITSELGRGGMGVVYLAERDDGLFEQKVAIKLIQNTIFSRTALERFANERRLLARLRHPNIAQILDGGVIPNGASYIIMELITGLPITDYCSDQQLRVGERIALFRQALAAVEHAHRNLIVHADIKASNVMVERGFGVKLLDFGIARLLTETDQGASRPYTPGHSSPAQIEGRAPVPRDDVFASGVLLRQLTENAGDDPDLEAISDKATANDPAARYGSIVELDQDVARWQQSRPLLARPPTRWRRANLFWRRHRLGLTIAASAAVLLLGTIVATTTLWLQAERARADAEARFNETRAMANYMLTEVDPELATLPGTLPLRRRLVSHGRDYLQALEKGRGAAPSLDLDIASGYLRLARIYGLDVSGGLGDLSQAEASLARAHRLLSEASGHVPNEIALLRLRAEERLIAASRMFVEADNARLAQGVEDADAAAVSFASYLKRVPTDTDARLSLWQAQIMPARAQAYRGDVSQLPALLVPALKNATIPVQTVSQRVRRDFLLNGTYLLLAESLEKADPSRAYSYYRLLSDHVDQMNAAGTSDLTNNYIQATARAAMGQIRYEQGDAKSAIIDYLAAISEMDRLLSAGPNRDILLNRRMVRLRLAAAFAKSGAVKQGRALIEQELTHIEKTGNVHFDTRWLALVYSASSQIEQQSGDKGSTCRIAKRAAYQWEEVRRTGAAMAIDEVAGGPIDATRARKREYCS
jgi:serine/threonine-protein kinase